MNRTFLALLAVLSMGLTTACGTVGTLLTGSPATVANQTKLDEQVGLTVTLAYTAAARAAGLAITTAAAIGKPLSPATVKRIGELDLRAFAAVTAVRNAYLSVNSASYLSALSGARAAVADLLAAAGGRPTAHLTIERPVHRAVYVRDLRTSDAITRDAHLSLARIVEDANNG